MGTATPTVSELVDTSPDVSLAPVLGFLFLVGTPTVTCIAKDAYGNSATVCFDVTVLASGGGLDLEPLTAGFGIGALVAVAAILGWQFFRKRSRPKEGGGTP